MKTPIESPPVWTLGFSEIRLNDLSLVGGKNASLGEMFHHLIPKGIRIPNGFAITAEAYRYFIRSGNLDAKIQAILDRLDASDVRDLHRRGKQLRQSILQCNLPTDLEDSILEAYDRLSKNSDTMVDVAVRSSATAEDLPDASFAGQQETYLNVQGHRALLDACKRCFASLFTDRAISYRIDKGFDHAQVALSVGVQKMVRSDLAASGVMFSVDTETGFKDAVLINAAYGLGENVVQGTVNPDEYYVFKPTLKQGFQSILQKTLGEKELRMVYDLGGEKLVKNIPVPAEDRRQFAITNDEILTLARWACLIEDHYSERKGGFQPMDIEWAKDGMTGELHILQARPETVQARRNLDRIQLYRLKQRGKILTSGRSVGAKIATGPVRVIKHINDIHQLKPGEVLVTDKTDPDWEPIMKIAAAIVTNRGGRTCHAAIISRELGVPAIVGTQSGTERLQTGGDVTVSCAEGDTGFVYDGRQPFEVEEVEIKDMQRPKTQIMMNAANPEEAFALSFIPNDGIGLARMEFIIMNTIKIHPLALLHFDQLPPSEERNEIEKLTEGYKNKSDYFVDQLAFGIGMLAAAFYPKRVILRLSDFKTNEYANLLGGKAYEPKEENPMIGFRGASRYYHERYRDGFGLECKAIRKVRSTMGLKNLKVMVPFCRTVEEGIKVQEEMNQYGLKRGVDELEIYIMCEVPSNVILAEVFSDYFDGFSIGSNDLTQLVLGVDRDSEIVAHVFDERNESVKRMITSAIQSAQKKGRKIGICGQAPSDFPDFAAFLVEQGIDSISLTPDTIIQTTRAILKKEQQLA